jgi:archaemetzincin
MKYLFYLLLIVFASCNTTPSYIKSIHPNDIEKLDQAKGDWLQTHPEKFVSFSDFENKNTAIPKQLTDTVQLLVLNSKSIDDDSILYICQEYLQAFFQRNVLLTTTKNLIPNSTNSRNGYDGQLQLNATFILDSVLNKSAVKYYLATMALTHQDIYPGNNWNYVFGLANYTKKVGVTSVYRFDATQKQLQLIRLIKTASHEICHMFGIAHCVTNECVMNGANHLQELDRNQLRLCSDCQQKLMYRLNIEPQKRLQDVLFFLKKYNLIEEYNIIALDTSALKVVQ